jgi:excisionase family DNA binding protein
MRKKEEEMLTATAAAERKGVSVKTVYRAIRDGRLPSQSPYGHLLIRVSDLDHWEPLAPRGRQRKASD